MTVIQFVLIVIITMLLGVSFVQQFFETGNLGQLVGGILYLMFGSFALGALAKEVLDDH